MTINSSGKTRSVESGSIRDDATGKPAMELLPLDLLMRVATWYALGAEKYGEDNWRLGQPQKKVIGSLLRHLAYYRMGDTSEDHLAAVVWNALCIMHVDEYLKDTPLFNGKYDFKK